MTSVELFDVHKIIDVYVVGESETCMATFTNWILACQNVNMTGQRSAGKTFITSNVAKLLPDVNGLYNLSSGSDKSHWYQAEALNKHSHVMIPELNKLPKQALEILKDWGEYRASDYSVTIFEAGNRRVHKYKMPPKPFIFCLADEEELEIDEQLRSRLTIIRVDISEDQNIAVNYNQAQLAMLPNNPKIDNMNNFDEVKSHIANMPPWDVESFRHPAATEFVNSIPTTFTNCRRDFPKYLRNTFGITRFYHNDRISKDINILDSNNKLVTKKIFMVTPADMFYNHLIYGNILIESSLRCNAVERTIIKILKETGQPVSRDVIQAKIRLKGMNISAQMITRHLKELRNLGYVKNVEVKKNTMAVYTVGELFKDFNFEVNWKEIIDICKTNIKKYYPEIADEYIKRFCEDPVVIHPYVGTEIKLLELNYEPKELEIESKGDEEDSNELFLEDEFID